MKCLYEIHGATIKMCMTCSYTVKVTGWYQVFAYKVPEHFLYYKILHRYELHVGPPTILN